MQITVHIGRTVFLETIFYSIPPGIHSNLNYILELCRGRSFTSNLITDIISETIGFKSYPSATPRQAAVLS